MGYDWYWFKLVFLISLKRGQFWCNHENQKIEIKSEVNVRAKSKRELGPDTSSQLWVSVVLVFFFAVSLTTRVACCCGLVRRVHQWKTEHWLAVPNQYRALNRAQRSSYHRFSEAHSACCCSIRDFTQVWCLLFLLCLFLSHSFTRRPRAHNTTVNRNYWSDIFSVITSLSPCLFYVSCCFPFHASYLRV